MMAQFTSRQCNLPLDFDYRNRHVNAITGTLEDQQLCMKRNRVGDTFMIVFEGTLVATARIIALEESYKLGQKYTNVFYTDFKLVDGPPPERTPGPGTTRYLEEVCG